MASTASLVANVSYVIMLVMAATKQKNTRKASVSSGHKTKHEGLQGRMACLLCFVPTTITLLLR